MNEINRQSPATRQSIPVRQSLRTLGTLLQLTFVGVVLDWMLFTGTQANLWVQLLLITLLLMAAWKWNGAVILVAFQFRLFMQEPGRSSMIPDLSGVIYGVLSLLIVAYACWSRAATSRISDWFADSILQWTAAAKSFATEPSENRPQDSQLAIEQVWLAGCTLLAMFFMITLPLTTSVREQWLQQAKANDFVLWPGATVVVLVIAVGVLARNIVWRQMSPAQASLYLKSTFVTEHFHDLRMIVLRRLKKRRQSKAKG